MIFNIIVLIIFAVSLPVMAWLLATAQNQRDEARREAEEWRDECARDDGCNPGRDWPSYMLPWELK